MKFQGRAGRVGLLIFTLVLMCAAAGHASPPEVYSFTIYNRTERVITRIFVSEDGDDYRLFDIGEGIVPSTTAELIWTESTNLAGCRQYIRAMFDDDSQSEAVRFDFCEPGGVLEIKQ